MNYIRRKRKKHAPEELDWSVFQRDLLITRWEEGMNFKPETWPRTEYQLRRRLDY